MRIPSPPASSIGAMRSMQSNRGRDTKPELLVRRLLRESGYAGYRVHWRKAPGQPDIAYPGRKVAIFVNGCYWHRCPHCKPSAPKAHAEFWQTKFAANEARDAQHTAELESAGWTVVTVWECELKQDPGEVCRRVVAVL